jgi:alpha-glucosidase
MSLSRLPVRALQVGLVLAVALAGVGVGPAQSPAAAAGVQRAQFTSGASYLVVEFLDDDLAHFELSAIASPPGTTTPVFTTDQVAKTDYDGPSSFSRSGDVFTTADMSVAVDAATLCATVTDTTRTPAILLHTVCPRNLSQGWKGLTVSKESMENAYGLGAQFFAGGSADGDWVGRTRTPGGQYGNSMVFDSDNGPIANTQIPVLFAVGAAGANYGLFLDHIYKQEWNLQGDPWTIDTWGDEIRWYAMTGADLPDLRADYMELTGHAPVPPKKAFGMWVSEFGYDDWAEVDETVDGLRASDIPVDGVMLDLQWFGGVTADSDYSQMGSLSWDETNFPDATTKLADLANEGIGVIPIEESYIAKGLDEHQDLEDLGYLVRQGCSTCAPVYLTSNSWWGQGGMIDWTNDAASVYWHDSKRTTLIDQGVMGHWLDLGEPEMYDSNDWTVGVLPGKNAHADYHNVYGFEWAQSIADGYERNDESARPFLLARTGAAGIQRFGAAMWSADIGSRSTALAAQQNVQMHMSMSGIDYYGSDIGGFRREMAAGDIDDLYTKWFANSAWFDTPVRPHTENLCNCLEVTPDAIGDVASNRQNIAQRYELAPYYYSLAHRAYRFGEPVVPPLVFHYQDDPAVREMGHEKMIGEDIIVGVVATEGERERDMYLPAGDWINYHTNEYVSSTGQWVADVPLYRQGKFTLPVFVRAGAIIPKSFVDAETLNIVGGRADGIVRDELIARVYSSTAASDFTVYDDDGTSTAYQVGDVRQTPISQHRSGSVATVTVGPATGMFAGAPTERATVVELVVDDAQASSVTVGGQSLVRLDNVAAFEAAASGWYNAGQNLIVAKAASSTVSQGQTFAFTIGEPTVEATFTCSNGATVAGQSVYAVGNIPQLGSWNPSGAVRLDATAYPQWSGTLDDLPPHTLVEWKCIKRAEAGLPDTADAWQSGANTQFTTPASGGPQATGGAF